ncbi:hypothetical protein [Acinetobacter calcoaceticus]|uniref:hypothetical protein n=1 Tax=Acinetobacter calcoaceticus TaxID=471 RepID=UPI003A89AC4F
MPVLKLLVSATPPEYEDKNMVYIFDSEDKFELTYDELVKIISKARLAGPKLIPVLERSKITSNYFKK